MFTFFSMCGSPTWYEHGFLMHFVWLLQVLVILFPMIVPSYFMWLKLIQPDWCAHKFLLVSFKITNFICALFYNILLAIKIFFLSFFFRTAQKTLSVSLWLTWTAQSWSLMLVRYVKSLFDAFSIERSRQYLSEL